MKAQSGRVRAALALCVVAFATISSLALVVLSTPRAARVPDGRGAERLVSASARPLNSAGRSPATPTSSPGIVVGPGGRRAGHFATSADSIVVYPVHKLTHQGAAGTWTGFDDSFNVDTLSGQRYVIEVVNGSTPASGFTVSINGQQLIGTGEFGTGISRLLRVLDVTLGSNAMTIQVKGTGSAWVSVRVVRVKDFTFDVLPYTTHLGPSPSPGGYVDNFTETSGSVAATVRVINGDAAGAHRVTGATLKLNGVQVLGTSDFSTGVAVMDRNVVLTNPIGANALVLTGEASGTQMKVRVRATSTAEPVITWIWPPDLFATSAAKVFVSANVSDQLRGSVSVNGRPSFTTTGPTYIFADSLPLPAGDGMTTVTVRDTNIAGLITAISRTVFHDTHAPTITLKSPQNDTTTSATTIAFVGNWTDALTATTLTVDGDTGPVPALTGAFNYPSVLLDPGLNAILVRAIDAAGNVTQFKRNVFRKTAADAVHPAEPTVASPSSAGMTPFLQSVQGIYQTASRIQLNVDSTKIVPELASVVRGRVLSRDWGPLGNVQVSVVGHLEYGTTATRDSGSFDMVVNGGAPLTFRFTRAGYLFNDRTITPGWNEYAMLDTIAMIGKSAKSTNIPLSSGVIASDMVARGRFATDDDGDRDIRVLFRQGTQIRAVLPSGTQILDQTATMRATEFTIGANGPKTMPASLPPSSAYTYCVGLSLDEADLLVGADQPSPPVLFTKPVTEYVRNFLHLPIGSSVPSGTYDAVAGVWRPDTDGVVMKIIAISGSPPIATIDSRGTGTADPDSRLAELSVDTIERQQLAAQFAVGDEIWRVRMWHFSNPDYNLNAARVIANASIGSGRAKKPAGLLGDCCPLKGSTIEVENRVLGESVPVVGTPYSLNYRSYRFPGDQAIRTLRIPVVGSPIPDSLTRAVIRVEVAGKRWQVVRMRSDLSANYVETYTWDGRDVYGRRVEGAVNARVSIGYGYPERVKAGAGKNSYGNPTASGNSVAWQEGNRNLDGLFWTRSTVSLGAASTRTDGLGGWTISPHHFYDMTGQGTLYRGDGSLVQGSLGHPIIDRAIINVSARDVVLGPDRNFYVAADCGIYKYSYTGTLLGQVVGTGSCGNTSFADGATANATSIAEVQRLAIGPDSSIYFVMHPPVFQSGDISGHVCKMTPDGKLHSIAGSDTVVNPAICGPPIGDGGPATAAKFSSVLESIALGPDGSVFVGDYNAHRVRRIGPDGIISTYAGTGCHGTSNVTGPADSLALDDPIDLATDQDGSLYIATNTGQSVRRVTPDGTISTLMTIPNLPPPGWYASGVVAAPDGRVYVAQSGAAIGGAIYNGEVFRYDADGTVTLVAGGPGVEMLPSYGIFATAHQMGLLGGIEVAPDGTIFMANLQSDVARIGTSIPSLNANQLVVPSDDGSEIYYFDASSGRHLSTKDALTGGTTFTFDYDAGGRLTAIHDVDGLPTTIQRDGTTHAPTSITAPFGQVTRLTTVANTDTAYLKSIANPASEVISLAPNSEGLLDSLMDERNGLHAFTWDTDGRLQKDADPVGGSENLSVAYDKNTRTVTRTTGESRQSTYFVGDLYDGTLQRRVTVPGNLRTVFSDTTNGARITQFPDGSPGSTMTEKLMPSPRSGFGMLAPVDSVTVEKLPSGLTRSVAIKYPSDVNFNPPNGTWTEETRINGRDPFKTEFDSANLKLKTTSPLLRTTSTTVDAAGRPLSVQIPGLSDVSYIYSQGLLQTLRQGARTWQYGYDASGRLHTVTDPQNRVTKLDYDAADRVTTQTLPDTQAVQFGYDKAGNLTGVTPPGRSIHQFGYTGVDLTQSYTPPDAGIGATTTNYVYNQDRQLKQIQRPDGVNVTLGYETSPNTPRLASVTIPRGSYAYTYKSTGQLNTVSSPDGITLTYGFDGPLPLSETWSGATGGHHVDLAYDTDFRPSTQKIDDNSATQIDFRYDLDGLLAGAGIDSLHRTPSIQASTGFIDSTALASLSAWSSQDYNGFGELVNLRYRWHGSADTTFIESMIRDDLGRDTTLSDQATADSLRTYQYIYTTAGRLKAVDRLIGQTTLHLQRYDYDANGNRTAFLGANVGDTATANYDAQDRMYRYKNTAYSYTKNGELTQTVSPAGTSTYTYDELGNLITAHPAGGPTITYLIDGQNRRVGRKLNGTLQKIWLYQNGLNVVAELDGAGALRSRFVYGSRANVPDYMVQGSTTYRIISDQLGSVRRVVNAATGEMKQRLEYDAWGNVVVDSNSGFQPFGFAGGLYDPDTKLTRFGARDYDANVGRWTCKDPLYRQAAATSLYSYAISDPVNYIDRDGASAAAVAVDAARDIEQALESTGHPELAAAVAAAVLSGAVAYEGYKLFSKGVQKGENEYTREAKSWAQRTGGDPCDFLRELLTKFECLPRSKESNEAIKKLQQARKFLGCKKIGGDR